MDGGDLATIIVALIAGLAGWAAQRAAAKASTSNVALTTRVDVEKDAYDRARQYDTETIRRQQDEIGELRVEIMILKRRIERCERTHGIPSPEKEVPNV